MSIRTPVLKTAIATGVLLLASASAAFAQAQSKAQQKCINRLNLDAATLAKVQGSENRSCLKQVGKGTLVGTAQACLTADAKGKVLKRKTKNSSDDAKYCVTVPNFGYTGVTTVNAAAVDMKLSLIEDLFGGDVDAAFLNCTYKLGCTCQQRILLDVEKLAATKFGEFLKCKKAALKAGATSAAALVNCVNDAGTAGSIAADTKGKIAKRLTKLNTDIVNKCDQYGQTATAFPGDCAPMTGAPFGACVDAQVECRLCNALNPIDNLGVDCDLFDDGVANLSCEVPGPTPTPTATLVPTPTPTVDPAIIFRGALTRSTGVFNYAMTPGVPGANAACNTAYNGSHACTYAELQAAELAGQLDGATDNAPTPNLVTIFWAIDPARPTTTQCSDEGLVPPMSAINWHYGTAHTSHFGESVTLNNMSGALGARAGDNCGNMRWVGCCM